MQGDWPDAASRDFDDSGWQRVGLPHSFSIPYFESKQFYMGYGWYRKTLQVNMQGECSGERRYFLEFDGVFQEAEIFVNGHLAGHHTGGYTGFCVPITPYLNDGDNTLAVRVNNLWQPDVAPRAGEHVFSGGIYRNVRLVRKSMTYIDWCGTEVTTPDLGKHKGKKSVVAVGTTIVNDGMEQQHLRLVTTVVDRNGREAVSTAKELDIAPGNVITIRCSTPSVKKPRLWCPEDPYIYKVVSRLYDGQRLIDSTETSFGFRWFEWTADHGFFLNGRHRYLRGANVHQDQAGWGDAVTDSAAARDVQMVKNAGMDFIRGSHYPHSPAFVKACDEKGMLFWSEAPYWSTYGSMKDGYYDASGYPIEARDTAAFKRSCIQQLREMIRIHRNSPSVIAWSMCNEPFFTARGTMDGVRQLLREMVDDSHKMDPARPAAIGGCQRPLGKDRLDLLGDIAGYNGDGASITEFQQPGIPSMVTEYGSTVDMRPGEYAPGWGDLEKGEAWRGLPWRSGQAIWCAFDHGTIANGDFGRMGFIDYQRLPKRRWYWYRREYLGIAPPEWPTDGVPCRLKLTATKTQDIKTDGTDDVRLTVSVCDATGRELSACPDVTFSVAEGPGEFPTGSSITFSHDSDIYIHEGKAAIALRSYYAGETLIVATSDGLQTDTIRLTFTGDSTYRKGVTPAPTARPYVRYSRQKTMETMTFGPGSPTFASSMTEGHSSPMATDNDSTTYWQAHHNDLQPTLTLDLERIVKVESVELTFPFEVDCSLELSTDQKQWTAYRIGLRARFVRLRFSGKAALSELKVKATD